MKGSGCSSSRSSAQRDGCDQPWRPITLARARNLNAQVRSAGAQVAAPGEAPHKSLLCWSVDNPANSRLGLTAAQSNFALVLQTVPWLRSCSLSCMNHEELRARIRKVIASGELPPVPNAALAGRAARTTRIVIGRSLPEPCSICDRAAPTVFYIYSDQSVVRVHAACEALWCEEGEAPS